MTNRRAAKKGRRRANRLDYGLLPEPESTPTFTSLPEELEAAMQRLPRTLRRMEAALSSAREIDSSREGGARAQRRAESAFRSALTEYIAIEDTFKRERPAGTPPFRLLDTTNPLPHILRLLRHLQTHHTASELSGVTISLWLKNVPGAEPQDVPVRVISDLTETQLLDLDAFKEGYYTRAQAREMVNWIKARQEVFGIRDIIYRGVEEAAERIVSTYLN